MSLQRAADLEGKTKQARVTFCSRRGWISFDFPAIFPSQSSCIDSTPLVHTCVSAVHLGLPCMKKNQELEKYFSLPSPPLWASTTCACVTRNIQGPLLGVNGLQKHARSTHLPVAGAPHPDRAGYKRWPGTSFTLSPVWRHFSQPCIPLEIHDGAGSSEDAL